jgi:hypothetical protein
MERSLDDLLEQGASGFSSGLMYSPGASAPVKELDELCRVVARRGLIYATHMRDYGDSLGEAVNEQIGIARRTGCRLQISHLQAVGPRNWPKQAAALETIEDAHRDGVDVAFDCYPYTRGSTVLTQLLPQTALDGGMNALLHRLSDANERRRIAVEMDRSLAQGWAGILISALFGIILLLILLSPLARSAEHNPLLPRPRKIQCGEGALALRGLAIRLASDASAEDRFTAQELSSSQARTAGISIPVSDNGAKET